MSSLFYVMTMPGLETLAFSEVRAHMPDAELVKFARGVALFRATATPAQLFALRTVEDVFFALVHIKGLGRGTDALRVLHSATLNADIAQGLALWRRVHDGRQPKTWRVVSQKSGTHEFRRVDAGQSVTAALQRVVPRAMRLAKDEADLECWLWLNGSEVLLPVLHCVTLDEPPHAINAHIAPAFKYLDLLRTSSDLCIAGIWRYQLRRVGISEAD